MFEKVTAALERNEQLKEPGKKELYTFHHPTYRDSQWLAVDINDSYLTYGFSTQFSLKTSFTQSFIPKRQW